MCVAHDRRLLLLFLPRSTERRSPIIFSRPLIEKYYSHSLALSAPMSARPLRVPLFTEEDGSERSLLLLIQCDQIGRFLEFLGNNIWLQK